MAMIQRTPGADPLVPQPLKGMTMATPDAATMRRLRKMQAQGKGTPGKPAKVDPDGDGDDDSTPEGDTDHSHWDESGKQIQALPGKPLPKKKGMSPVAARIFAKK